MKRYLVDQIASYDVGVDLPAEQTQDFKRLLLNTAPRLATPVGSDALFRIAQPPLVFSSLDI